MGSFKRQRGLVIAWILFATCAGSNIASAGTGYDDPRCWIQSGTAPTWATTDLNREVSGNSPVQSVGFLFADGADSEIQCTWTVPGDYNTSGSAPAVRIWGWSIADVTCSGLSCLLDLVVRFDIASRPWSDDEALGNIGWNGTAAHGEIHYTSTTCGAGSCYPGNHARTLSVVPVSATTNWAPGEIVMIRIRRKTSGLETGQGNLTEDFHLASVQVSYPN